MSESSDAPVPAAGDAWADLQEAILEAGNLVEVIDPESAHVGPTLEILDGADASSALVAMATHIGAIVVDDWLVLLGSGGGGFPGLREFNGRGGDSPLGPVPGALVVGIDRLGGGFAVNGGGLPVGEVGEVCYLAPDDLEWMPCGMGHAEFVWWAIDGDVEGFFEDLRWPTWREESTVLRPGNGFNLFPPPWSQDAVEGASSRGAAPLLEVWGVVLSQSLLQGGWSPPAQD